MKYLSALCFGGSLFIVLVFVMAIKDQDRYPAADRAQVPLAVIAALLLVAGLMLR